MVEPALRMIKPKREDYSVKLERNSGGPLRHLFHYNHYHNESGQTEKSNPWASSRFRGSARLNDDLSMLQPDAGQTYGNPNP